MNQLKNKINYTVACVNEFAKKLNLGQREAFIYLYKHKSIAFIKEHCEIEHTLSFEEAINDLILVCRNNGGNY